MSTKGRVVLMIIAGGYLVYQGVSLLKGAFVERPDNYLVFMAFGAGFLVFGGILLLLNLKRMIRHEYVDPFRELDEVEETVDEAEETVGEAEEDSEMQKIGEEAGAEAEEVEERVEEKAEKPENEEVSCE